MARKRSALRNWLEFLPLRLLFMALRWLPQWISYPLCAGLGRLFLLFAGKRRRTALAGIARAMPDLSERERRRIAFTSAGAFARTLVDVARMPRVLGRGDASDWVDLSQLDQALAEIAERFGPGPIVICTPHLGSWEAAISAMSFRLNPLHLIGRRMENPLLDRMLIERRSAAGQKVYAKKGGVRPLARALQRGESVAFAADQNQRRGKSFVRFFGELASCDRGPVRLARQFGRPILVGAVLRKGGGFCFCAEAADCFLPGRSGEAEGEFGIDPDLQRLHTAFERLILRFPEQYLWMHDRWRTRPREETTEALR
ncbi:MAG: hypothetical protein CSA62_15385 [Planctomycetota bacterium]|nr:MAG: hypothetical protein CSA62_15385 [Planctomycetota bacterium]